MTELLDSLVTAFAAIGVAGLFALAVGERLIPVLPSHAMLVLAGLGAAEGTWTLGAALAATCAGSLAGAVLVHAAAARLRGGRWRALATHLRFGVARFDSLAHVFGKRRVQLTLLWQTVPGLRLLGPALAGALGMPLREFLPAAIPGIVLWNAAFVGLGHAAAHAVPREALGELALRMLFALLGLQILGWLALRRLRTTAAARAAAR